MPDGDVLYLPDAVPTAERDTILRRLIAEVPWRQESIVVWGKSYLQPRLIAWYGDPGCSYSYSGIALSPLPWDPLLLELKDLVESISGSAFNSVLINYYRDHRDSMGLHSDDEPELGARPILSSLSLGQARTLTFKHKARKNVSPVKIRLASGSLLLMRGDTQHYWKHGIDKETRPCGPRVNLTFRQIVARSSGH